MIKGKKMRKVTLKEGQSVFVRGSQGDIYEIKQSNGVIYCECKAWEMMKEPIERRRCKHMIEVLNLPDLPPIVVKDEKLVAKFEAAFEKAMLEFQTIKEKEEALWVKFEREMNALQNKGVVISEKTGIPFSNGKFHFISSDYCNGTAVYYPTSFATKFKGLTIEDIDVSCDDYCTDDAIEYMIKDLSNANGDWYASSC